MLYIILLSRDLKTKKDRYPHPHQDHRNKTKIFWVKSEILIVHDKVRSMDSSKANSDDDDDDRK